MWCIPAVVLTQSTIQMIIIIIYLKPLNKKKINFGIKLFNQLRKANKTCILVSWIYCSFCGCKYLALFSIPCINFSTATPVYKCIYACSCNQRMLLKSLYLTMRVRANKIDKDLNRSQSIILVHF